MCVHSASHHVRPHRRLSRRHAARHASLRSTTAARGSSHRPPAHAACRRLFFKLLHVQPLALNVSFAAQPGQRQSMASYQINPLYTLMAVLQSGLGSINDAPLRLNGKLIENALGTSDTIVWSLVSHYIQQGVMEAYKIVGSIEAIGNPVALAHDIGTKINTAQIEWLKATCALKFAGPTTQRHVVLTHCPCACVSFVVVFHFSFRHGLSGFLQ